MKVPSPRYSYAVKHGTYAGEILIFIKKNTDLYDFLSVPKMINRSIPEDKFNYAYNSGIIDFVEKIPKEVYKTVVRQFEKNRNSLSN